MSYFSPDDLFLRLTDFAGSTTSYRNVIMKSIRYRLIRDKDVIMEEGFDYDKNIILGGFDLLNFEMDADTVIVCQFY